MKYIIAVALLATTSAHAMNDYEKVVGTLSLVKSLFWQTDEEYENNRTLMKTMPPPSETMEQMLERIKKKHLDMLDEELFLSKKEAMKQYVINNNSELVLQVNKLVTDEFKVNQRGLWYMREEIKKKDQETPKIHTMQMDIDRHIEKSVKGMHEGFKQKMKERMLESLKDLDESHPMAGIFDDVSTTDAIGYAKEHV